MKIQFLGAAGTVTGSRYLLTEGKTKVLVDCGLFQGIKDLRQRNWDHFPMDVQELEAVVLTHAHLDHSGYIPLLVKNGFRGAIYATRPTFSLCKILLPDSGYLQEEEARFANQKGYSKHNPALPLYTLEDAKASLNFFRSVDWKEPFVVSRKGLGSLSFRFFPAGHLLGAASVHVKTETGSVVFSGDLGRTSDPLIRHPAIDLGADNLVVESTYGNRSHPQTDPQEELKEIILRTYEKDGILLIPSFAVGRAQLILYYIQKLKIAGLIPKNLPVYLNSPMANEANEAFLAHVQELKIGPTELEAIWNDVRIVRSPEQSKKLNDRKEPAIIIAASGMATGGRVLHHLKTLAPDPKNTVLFVGFQAGGTRGELMVRGAKAVKIHGELWPIRAEVVNMATLSAHADADEVMAWISRLPKRPRRIFVTHGEPEAAEALQQRLEQEFKVSAFVPEHLQTFDL